MVKAAIKAAAAVKTEVGEQLLRKAVAAERDAKKFYGAYVQWVAKQDVPEGIILKHLIEIVGYSAQVAEKRVSLVKKLGQPQNKRHLDALIGGKIDFGLALIRVAGIESKPREYNDEETAQRGTEKVIRIMQRVHKNWKRKDMVAWFESICKSIMS